MARLAPNIRLHVDDESQESGQRPDFPRGCRAPRNRFLDLPALSLIIALGALKPDSWALFAVGSVIAIAIFSALTYWIPRLYPWCGEQSASSAD
jgi:hypothetical protein